MGYIGVGVGGVNPLPAGTGGGLWYYSPQSGVRNFPKKLTFLRLNDLVNFHNFISQKNWHFPIPTPSYFKKASRKNFSRKFSNFVHTIKKQFSILLFFVLQMKALKNFSRKFSKILRLLIEMRGQKITGKNWKLYSF